MFHNIFATLFSDFHNCEIESWSWEKNLNCEMVTFMRNKVIYI